MTDLLRHCLDRRTSMVETISRLAALESPSDDKAALDRCIGAFEELLRGAGAGVERLRQDAAGDHLRAVFAPTLVEPADARRQVLLLGHLDTVWPVGQVARMPVVERDGRLHGPGVFDMKAGLVIGLTAIEAVRSCLATRSTRLMFLVTSDEEVGSVTSRALIEEEARRSDAVLVLEPSLPGGVIKTARKGVGEFTVTAHGVAAHAGVEPGKGASAILEIARQVLALDALQAPERGLTINVGVVEGGSRTNVVAERATARVDVRVSRLADAAGIEQAIRSLAPHDPRVRLEIGGGINRPPMERTAGVGRLYGLAREVARELGIDLQEGATGGASDGNFTAAIGIDTLDGLGAVGDGAHALHEHVVIDELPVRAAILAGLIARLTDAPDGRPHPLS